jgi:hypothetical protein
VKTQRSIVLENLTASLLSFIVLFLLFSCKEKKANPADVCENAICPEIFKFASVKVKDKNGQPYELDDYYTAKPSTGGEIRFTGKDVLLDSIRRTNGVYPILSDTEMGLTTIKGVDFQFHGFKDGKEVITENYKINHNCCNVNIISGPLEITIP